VEDKLYSVYEYLDKEGNFDYESYKSAQVKANKRKINKVWVQEDNVKFLADYLKKRNSNIAFGICHGTRRGLEQKWFKKYLGCEVIGTEISDTATDFPDTIQWDFHDVKKEWVGSTDFIYSNSLDHSYDPRLCLQQWMKCLNNKGLCILEYSPGADERTNSVDSFGTKLPALPYLILEWGSGKFFAIDLIKAPAKIKYSKASSYSSWFLVIKNA